MAAKSGSVAWGSMQGSRQVDSILQTDGACVSAKMPPEISISLPPQLQPAAPAIRPLAGQVDLAIQALEVPVPGVRGKGHVAGKDRLRAGESGPAVRAADLVDTDPQQAVPIGER